MDLIYTDIHYQEKGYLKNCEIDIELGSFLTSSSDNTFQITMNIDRLPKEVQIGSLIYEIGTEAGGIVNGIGVDTSTNKAYVYGVTWRGMLQKKIIQPQDGQAYLQIKGDANEAIKTLIDNEFDGLIIGSQELSGINVNKEFRYIPLGEGIEKMLSSSSARINIKSVRKNDTVVAIVSASAITNYSDDVELNNDYGISLTAKKIKNGVNHVICLGKGELENRTVIHLYKLANGSITTDPTNSIKGLNQTTIIYDYSSAESDTDLIEGGKKKFDENANEENLEMNIDMDVEIGDIVAARERVTEIYMQKQVSQKIYKGYIDNVKIEYKVGE